MILKKKLFATILCVIFSGLFFLSFINNAQYRPKKSSDAIIAKDYVVEVGNLTYTVEKGVKYDSYLAVLDAINSCPDYLKYGCTNVTLTTRRLYSIIDDKNNIYSDPKYDNAVGLCLGSVIYIKDNTIEDFKKIFFHEMTHCADAKQTAYYNGQYLSDQKACATLCKKYVDLSKNASDKDTKYFAHTLTAAIGGQLNHEFLACVMGNYFSDYDMLSENYPDLVVFAEDHLETIKSHYEEKIKSPD